MVSINKKSIICLSLLSIALNGCSKSNAKISEPNLITIKVYHNQEWDKWQKERQGFESGTKYIMSDYFKTKKQLTPNNYALVSSNSLDPKDNCNEIVTDFARDDLFTVQQQQKGRILLKEIDNYKYDKMTHVANVTIENKGSVNSNLEEVWKLSSLTDDWFNKSIEIVQPFPGCKIPRNSVMGDFFQMPNGDKYVVDYLGFGSYDDKLQEHLIIQ